MANETKHVLYSVALQDMITRAFIGLYFECPEGEEHEAAEIIASGRKIIGLARVSDGVGQVPGARQVPAPVIEAAKSRKAGKEARR